MAKNKHSKNLPFHPEGEDELEDDSQFPQTQFDPSPDGDMWLAKAILKERGKKYLVDWEGVDEHGKPYEPTWEPKSNCTDDLIAAWKDHLREERQRRLDAKAEDSSFDPKSADKDSKGKRKRKTSEVASESAKASKKPRASRGRSSAASSSSSARPRQLDLEPSPTTQSSAATSSKATGADEDLSDEDDTPRKRRGTYSRKKSDVPRHKKKAFVDSDDDQQDDEETQPSRTTFEADGTQDSDEETQEPPKKKRGRPRKSVSQPTQTSDDDTVFADEVPKKKLWTTRQSGPPLPPIELEEPESQETDTTVPATPSPNEADSAEQSSAGGAVGSGKPLSVVREESEPETEPEEDDDAMEDDQFVYADDQDMAFRDDLEDAEPVAGPSGTNDGDDDELADANTSRGTVIPDSQAQSDDDALPLPSPARARQASPDAAAELAASSSQIDEIESSQEEEPVVVAAAAAKSKPVRPLGDYSPSRIRPFAAKSAHLIEGESPMSSQVEEFTTSSLENQTDRANKRSAHDANARLPPANAEAGPSRTRPAEPHRLVDDDGDQIEIHQVVSSVASSIETVESPVGPVVPAAPPVVVPSRSLDDNLLRRAVAGSVSAAAGSSAQTSTSRPMLPLSSHSRKFNFSSEAREEGHASTSRSDGVPVDDLALAAVQKAMAADAMNGDDASPELYADDGLDFDDYLMPQEHDDEQDAEVSDQPEVEVPEVAAPDSPARERSMEVDEPVQPTLVNGVERSPSPADSIPAAEEVAVSQLEVSDSLEEDILARVAAADARAAAAESQLEAIKDTLAAGTAQIEHLQGRVKSSSSDNDFLRSQYREQSHQYARVSGELAAAEEKVVKLEKALDVGLRQHEAISQARVAKITEEKDQALLQVKLLTDQSRLTGDALRQKAAKVPVLERQVRAVEMEATEQEDYKLLAKVELQQLQKKYDRLKKTIRNGAGHGVPGPTSLFAPPPNASSSSSSSGSSSESEDGSFRDASQPQGTSFGSQTYPDLDSGSEDEFRPSMESIDGSPRAAPVPRTTASRRSTQQANTNGVQTTVTETTTTTVISQSSTGPSSAGAQPIVPVQRRVRTASQVTDSESSSSDSSVDPLAVDAPVEVAMEIEDERTPERELAPPVPSLPTALVLCRWADLPGMECGRAFESHHALEVHTDLEHVPV